MSAFTGCLTIRELEPGRLWQLVDPVRYEVGSKGSGAWIEVPSGFETDGASIPTFARLFLAIWGTYGRAAVIHDLLYRLLAAGTPHQMAPTRRDADRVFREAMAVLGTATALRWAMWAAVRVGGGFALHRLRIRLRAAS